MPGEGGGELDRQQHGAQMPLELGRQRIDMLPLQGGFVKAGRAGELVGNAGELVAGVNFQIKQRDFSRFFGGVTSLKGAHWVSEDTAEKRFFSAKKNKRAYDTTR